MEGLSTGNSSGANYRYMSIMNGKLVLRAKEGDTGAVSRVNKNGDTVHELLFTGVTGMIRLVTMEDGKFGKELHIVVRAGKTDYVLQTPANGGYAFGFLCRVLNIDFTLPIEIRPFSITDETTKKTKNLTVVYQKGKGYEKDKIPSAFTKEAPNGLPELKQVTVKGQTIWDDTERVEFFEQLIYSDGGLNEQLAAMYTDKPATEEKDTFLDEISEPTKEAGVMLEDAISDKTPNATAAIKKATEEGAKITAAKKAAAKKSVKTV